MESRIRQMESAITAAIESSGKRDDTATIGNGNMAQQVGISDRLSMVVINEHGGSNFVGSSSGFSLFSPCGLRWISEKTGNRDLERLVSRVLELDPGCWDQGRWSKSVNLVWHPIPTAQQEPFPPKAQALEYVEAFFLSFNSIFPLFDRAIFDARFERQYSDNPPSEVGWYACFNVILAFGSGIIRIQYPLTDPSHSVPSMLDFAEGSSARYLRNATSSIIDIQFGMASLMSVQAVIAMAFMLQGSSNPLSVFALVAIAGRLAHAIGLHRNLDEFGLSKEQAIERQNVFWILYIVDKGITIQSGRPSVIHDQDVGVALPKEGTCIARFPSGRRKFDTFINGAKLAIIESRVYDELYSIKSRTRSVLQRLTSVATLDAELQKWRESIPIEIRPEHEIFCDEQQLMPVMVLHYSYYNCLTAIHRVSIYHGLWTSEPAGEELVGLNLDLNPRVYASEEICVAAARNVIYILDPFKKERTPPMIWMTMSQPLCASLTLFANILKHPEDPAAASDLDLMYVVNSFLGQLVAQGRLHFATGTLWIFQELHPIAELYLARKRASPRAGEEAYYLDSGGSVGWQNTTTDIAEQSPTMLHTAHDISPVAPNPLHPNPQVPDSTPFDHDMMTMLSPECQGRPGWFAPDNTGYTPKDLQQDLMI
ncbi:MAG: hypothetical protein M1818_003729 [Claussenomyces sp. TS43310]|nr:MAG: hypothetical protein M1818_003729 [Claussenomyces sp. TS43310]